MSRDPFEELFGPLGDDVNDTEGAVQGNDAPTAPLPTTRPAITGVGGQRGDVDGIRRRQGSQIGQPTAPIEPVVAAPMSARQPLAREQAERVMAAQAAPERRDRRKITPWLVVGIVAVAAIVGSISVVNAVRGGDTEAADTTAETAPSATPKPQTPVVPETPTEPEEKPEPEKKPSDEAPKVEVGPTNVLPIEAWSATSQLSARLGSTSYSIPDNVNLELTSDLLGSFPAGCGFAANAWGATRLDDGSFAVRKPAAICTEAPELYDEVWGLVAAWVDTIKTV